MQAEIINVGTELLLGHVVNSNAAVIARKLAELGINLRQIKVIGDNAQRLEDALRESMAHNDIVITTGGLGPTDDDLTREVASRVCEKELVIDEKSLIKLKEYLGAADLSPNQYKQALLPKGSIVFYNEAGTAPGCAIPFGEGKFVILLPGPPGEMNPMLEKYVTDLLRPDSAGVIHSDIVRTFALGEGRGAAILDDLTQAENPSVATYASDGEMFVKVTASAADGQTAMRMNQPVLDEIKSRFGDYVYAVNEESLAAVAVRLLLERKQTVSCAESCTGGLLAKSITDIPGASGVFRLGVVTYANEEKERILDIPARLIELCGAVSPEVAFAMAKNVKKLDRSDYGIGITGIAGPDGGTPQKPVGLVYIALAHPSGCWIREMRPAGKYRGRQWVRARAVKNALDLLRRHLTGLPAEVRLKL